MQTFLPYPSFMESASCLDYRRLGKQRVEAKQILNALEKGPGAGWYNHPAVRMWEGHELCLCEYGIVICEEWISRGYKDNLLPWFDDKWYDLDNTDIPSWLGNPKFHASHRSNLLRKDFEYYSRFNWKEPDNLEYYWPIKTT